MGSTLGFEDSFIQLFNNLRHFYDIEKSWELVNNCISFMKKDFFLSKYIDKFTDMCRDLILEKIILLNKRISFNCIVKNLYPNKSSNDVCDILENNILRNYPNAEISKNLERGFIEYVYTNDGSEIYHLHKSKELLNMTLNTVELLKSQNN